jgi:hypothetical protein
MAISTVLYKKAYLRHETKKVFTFSLCSLERLKYCKTQQKHKVIVWLQKHKKNISTYFARKTVLQIRAMHIKIWTDNYNKSTINEEYTSHHFPMRYCQKYANFPSLANASRCILLVFIACLETLLPPTPHWDRFDLHFKKKVGDFPFPSRDVTIHFTVYTQHFLLVVCF